jgi:putative transposase
MQVNHKRVVRIMREDNLLALQPKCFIRLKAEFVYLAVILDGFSRKVLGWALDHTLAMRLTVGALEQAIERRQPEPGLVHHSGRGFNTLARNI